MEVYGETSKITKIIGDRRQLVKHYGKERALKIQQRLGEFSAAENLTQISYLPPARLHRLKGDRQYQFAVDIGANWRIIFEGYDEYDELSVEKSEIVTLSILGIEDYH
ncbi:plasmid maintenance system killer protein [Streptococcus criceti]|uniref:Toxin-antitoxin system, toxin component, RelE family n=1 Tax=Streptococcus criceti HS-6 TaxID=873449 RepID=G5JSE1_STRCG|nr:type II toxin-antitoxin system RelE/ParE family toxin [Streptococcus criceti]EHI74624.1 toxin-antitoxin system, toxin component, RelE family [Streptococcus criceti HS-6]SUN42790.1 plasmid maintenance system killer protein [Streptococcus criceti]